MKSDWTKDDITDFVHEIDAYRNSMLQGKHQNLSEECDRFLRSYMHQHLSDERRLFFHNQLVALGVAHVGEVFDNIYSSQ